MKRMIISHVAIVGVLIACVCSSAAFSQKAMKRNVHGAVIAEADGAQIQYVPGEVLIRFQKGALDSTELERDVIEFDLNDALLKKRNVKEKLGEKQGHKLRRVITKLRPHHQMSKSRLDYDVPIGDMVNLMVLRVPHSVDILKLCEELEKVEGIVHAQPNFIYTLAGAPNDPHYSKQRGFESASDKDIDANRAWDISAGNYTVKVGVLDSGIDYHNPDLGNGSYGVEGNKVRGGWDYINNDANPDDDDDHGTACAGIIGALRNNSVGVAGLAGGAGAGNIGSQLFALKVANSQGIINSAWAINAIIEASVYTPNFGYGCHVLNNSWGGYGYDEEQRNAIRIAAENNVSFVTITHNQGQSTITYPGAYDEPWVIAVGASDTSDRRAIFGSGGSNYGAGTDFVAPGTKEGVYTTRRTSSGTYGGFDGTSMAGPHVAGLAALMRSVDPTLHVDDLQWIIKLSAEKVNPSGVGYLYSGLYGWNNEMGYGRINAGLCDGNAYPCVEPAAIDGYRWIVCR